MQNKTVIILLSPGKEPICRGNFKKLCLEFHLPYHYLKKMKLPIEYKGHKIYRVPFNEENEQ
jgi:hypothetical protein